MTEPCPLHDNERQPCEIWTRVMGYHRPVDAWNEGKKSEHATRKWFTEERAAASGPREVQLVTAE